MCVCVCVCQLLWCGVHCARQASLHAVACMHPEAVCHLPSWHVGPHSTLHTWLRRELAVAAVCCCSVAVGRRQPGPDGKARCRAAGGGLGHHALCHTQNERQGAVAWVVQ